MKGSREYLPFLPVRFYSYSNSSFCSLIAIIDRDWDKTMEYSLWAD
jgi:hypothetical protein